MRAEGFFLAATLLAGTAFVFLTPPFGAPDEPAHLYRAWDVGEGRLSPTWVAGRGGAMLPSSLRVLTTGLIRGIPGHPERKIEPGRIIEALGVPLRPEEREFVEFSNTAQFPFLPYAPQALGLALGRSLGAPPLACLYAGRLMNLIAASALIALAIRTAPALGWLLALIALTPTAVFLRASLSADALTMAAAMWLAAVMARAAFSPGRTVTRGDTLLMCAGAAAVWLTKLPYGLLSIMVVLVPGRSWPPGTRARALAAYGGVSALAIALALAAAAHVRERFVTGAPARLRHLLRHPAEFIAGMAADYWHYGFAYALQAVGQLGWLDTPLPTWWRALYLLVLLILLGVDGSPLVQVARWQRAVLGAIVLAVLTLISASQYVLSAGVQGRYLIPVTGAAVWILHRRPLASPGGRLLGWSLAAFSAVSLAIALYAVRRRYYP